MANSMLMQVIESMEHLQHDQQCLSILGRWIERHREGVSSSSSSSSSSSGGSFRSWLSISTTISKPIEEARPTKLHREVCRVVVEEIWLISLAWLGEQRRNAHTSKVIEHVDDGPVSELQRHLILSIELVLLLDRWETVLFELSQVEHRLDGHLSRGREHDASRSRVGIVRSDGTRNAAISSAEISLRAMIDSKVGELGHSEGLGSERDVAIQPSVDQ